MHINLEKIHDYVHEHMPLTNALGAKIKGYDGKKVSYPHRLHPTLIIGTQLLVTVCLHWVCYQVGHYCLSNSKKKI